MDLSSLSDTLEKLGKVDISAFRNIEPPRLQYDFSKFDSITIDPEDTIMGDIKRQIATQNKLVEQQIGILVEQNKLLSANYDKLKDMYDAQETSYNSAREDLERSRIFNRWMMVIAIVAMLAAVAGPIVTVLVSG